MYIADETMNKREIIVVIHSPRQLYIKHLQNHVLWKSYINHVRDGNINDSYFKTSSSLAVRWGLLSPEFPAGVGSLLELKERSFTPWVIDVDPAAEVADFRLKIPFIASALREKQRYVTLDNFR